MEKEEFIKIAEKLVEGTASEEELTLYHAFYNQYQLDYPTWNQVHEDIKQETKIILLNKIHAGMSPKSRFRLSLWPRIAVAASLFLAISAALFYINPPFEASIADRYKNDVNPGTKTAVLILSNGKRIDLKDAENGMLVEEGGITVTKAANGRLIYHLKDAKSNAGKMVYNTIETPAGGEYQLNLPDGTAIWLNASSSIRYPIHFAGKWRKVELRGEAYFEVAKSFDKLRMTKRPFIVVTDKQEVEVLGTHFNINSYEDEPVTKTTLLEGSVKVRELHNLKEQLLVPGQQAILKGTSLQVAEVDPEVAVAWKNGFFMFDKENLHSIMNQLSRWYNVEIIYEKGVNPDQIFAGSISKFKKVSQALEILELTRTVHFKIEGRRITVMK